MNVYQKLNSLNFLKINKKEHTLIRMFNENILQTQNRQSFLNQSSQRGSHRKHGIRVTLSKEKKDHSKQSKDSRILKEIDASQFRESIAINNRSYQHKIHKTSHDSQQGHKSLRASQAQSDITAVYMGKREEKLQKSQQAEHLSQQIRNLQLEIYNARTKISELNYLSQNKQKQDFSKRNERGRFEEKPAQKRSGKPSDSIKNDCSVQSGLSPEKQIVNAKVQNVFVKRDRSQSPPAPEDLARMIKSGTFSNQLSYHESQDQQFTRSFMKNDNHLTNPFESIREEKPKRVRKVSNKNSEIKAKKKRSNSVIDSTHNKISNLELNSHQNSIVGISSNRKKAKTTKSGNLGLSLGSKRKKSPQKRSPTKFDISGWSSVSLSKSMSNMAPKYIQGPQKGNIQDMNFFNNSTLNNAVNKKQKKRRSSRGKSTVYSYTKKAAS